MDETCDLKELQQRVNDSQQMFLRALGSYDDGVADFIIERFLDKFLGSDPARSEISAENALEARTLIRNFGNVRASLASLMLLLTFKMRYAVTELTLNFITLAMKSVGDLEVNSSVEQAKIRGEKAACAIGEHIDRVQRLAAEYLLMRHATLTNFKAKNFELSHREVLNRIISIVKNDTKREILEQTWDKIRELTEALVEITIEEEPLGRAIAHAEQVAKVFKGKNPNMSAENNGTEVMNRLLKTLRKEKALFEELEKSCQEVIDDIDLIGKSTT